MHAALALAALAAPAVLASNPAWEEANRELGWRVRTAVAQDNGLEAELELAKRDPQYADGLDALEDSDTLLIGGGTEYRPYKVPCPTDVTWIRSATEGLSQGEKDYLAKRQPSIDTAFASMMDAAGLAKPDRTPVVALALSGGGYRAMINGLGMTQALMDASEESKSAGTGGWLDVASYMAGLSGGSWATGAFIANGGQLPTELVKNVMNLDSNLVFPSNDKVSFYYNMLSNVRAKAGEGFPTQITDYWALALGNHLLPEQWRLDTQPNITFDGLLSNITQLQNAELPVPIIIAAEREPNEVVVPANSTQWEFTPWEYGSWAIGDNNEKTAGFFTPIEYIGTRMNNGTPASDVCYKGFDQLSFVMGTSSTLFNAGLLQLAQLNDTGVTNLLKDILSDIADDKNDVSQYVNFLANYTGAKNPVADLDYLTMVDAGETNQNIPIEPLLMPFRNVDAILAFDNSADTLYSWPNGSSLWTTYQRALEFKKTFGITIRMPEVPSTAGFVNEGLNTRPVFFGCNNTDTPLVVYVPHYPWSWYSNSSTFQLEYQTPDALRQVESAMRSVTLNGTVPEWPKCLACALSDRAFGYTAANRSSECAACFDTWCWSGVDASSEPEGAYEPLLGVTPSFLVDKGLSNSVQTSGLTQAEATAAAAGARPLLGGASIAAAMTAAALGALTVLF